MEGLIAGALAGTVCAMQDPDKRSSPHGSGRILMLGTFGLAAAAAAVLALGAQDARLLRLGLVAALWAALFGAFAAARMLREINSGADRVDQLRTVYQLELEREVAARREHELTVERELREQAQHAERDNIAALRMELGAMRAKLENLRIPDLPIEAVARAQSRRLLPLPDCSPTAPDGEPQPRFGPSPRFRSDPDTRGRPPAAPAAVERPPGDRPRHGGPSRESSGSNGHGSHTNGAHTNGAHTNGAHRNGGGPHPVPGPAAAAFPTVQRSVSDLLAANGGGPEPRRRRSREAG
ncbi:MAG TPA: DUF6779 domain-containing protein [Pseudonocardiaceae bacterium]